VPLASRSSQAFASTCPALSSSHRFELHGLCEDSRASVSVVLSHRQLVSSSAIELDVPVNSVNLTVGKCLRSGTVATDECLILPLPIGRLLSCRCRVSRFSIHSDPSIFEVMCSSVDCLFNSSVTQCCRSCLSRSISW
jgi:hypothetical protein